MQQAATAEKAIVENASRNDVVKVALASFVGTFIEFYDFFLYGAAAALIFPHLFFSDMTPTVASIVSFATLGVTFITRPLGAVIFGHYGDTIGRKKMLVLSLVIMGAATFLIGLLPTYAMIGIWAPILLVVLRLGQGIAVGGEWGGATTMIIEYAPARLRGFYGTFVQLGNVVGLLVSTGAFAIASRFDEAAFLGWGWRIPFLFSIVLLGVGIFIRLKLEEPPAFRQLKARQAEKKLPVVDVFKRFPRQILIAIGLRFGDNALGYLIISWMLSYGTTHLGASRDTVLFGVMMAAACAIVTFPLLGYLSDLIGRRAIFMGGAIVSCFFAFPFFWMLNSGSPAVLQLALIIGYAGVMAAMFAIQPCYISELFSTDVRYSGVSLGYQLASILGGFTPAVAAGLLALSGGHYWPIAIFLIVCSFVTVVATAAAGETKDRTIEE